MVHDDNGDHNLATGPSHHHLNMSEEEDPWNRNAGPGNWEPGTRRPGGKRTIKRSDIERANYILQSFLEVV
jgi:hypothetical protein